MTTAGNPGDHAVTGNTFSLISIDTVFYNGTDLNPASNWFSSFGAQPPPFNGFALSGTIQVVSAGNAIVTPGFTSVGVFDSSGINTVQLGASASFLTRAFGTPAGLDHYSFNPTSTSFTFVPEPCASLCFCMLASGIGGACIRRRLVKRAVKLSEHPK